MLQELNQELRLEIEQQLFSSLKNYLQFNFEGRTFIIEYSSILWFSAKIMFLQEMIFPQASALYYLKDSPNFHLFLEQVTAFKVEVDQEKIRILSLVALKGEINLKKATFREDIQRFCAEHPEELRQMIESSLNQFQVHYLKQQYLPAEREIRKCLDNDQGFIFLEMGNLMIHGVVQLPGQKYQQKIMPKQANSPCFESYQVSEEIFGQLQEQDNLNLDGIVNLISQYRYFTFYNQRFLLLHYTVLLRVFIIDSEDSDDRNSISTKQKEINENVVLQSALFAVTESNQHILLNIQEDAKCLYPQMQLLLSKQQSELMKPEKFMEVFAHKINHPKVNPQKDIQEISQLFSSGSVLIYKTSLFINRACVYLGNDLIITVVLEDDMQNFKNEPLTDDARARKENEEIENQGKIFKFQQFDQFISEPTDIQEIRFSFQPYNKQELLDKALQMNQGQFDFNIYKQNSEHLAFQLATGFRYSPQQNRLVNKIGEAVIDLFGWKGKIHEGDI